MVTKGKASAKRKQQKEEEVEEEVEKQVKAPKRSKKQEEEEQKAAEAAAAKAAADEAEASEEEDAEGESEDEGEDGEDDGEPLNTDIFEAELKQREEELGKHCMVVGALDEEDEEEEEEDEDEDGKQPSLEQLRALARVFVPKKVEEYYAELAVALSKIGGPESEEEDDEDEEGMDPAMKAMMAEAGFSFRMLNTRHSYPMQDLLKASLAKADKAIKSNKWEDGFCHWAATVQAARRETHWFQDTDVPEVVEAIYEKLRTQWVKLQKRSDEELGGLVVEGAASSKEAFSAFLQALADELQGMEYKAKDVVKS
ncbi:hypothetical protein OEZ85_005056 [Tetradesmus obliquus]|uniref:Uncharacterized protein n=1 Tax=Tetradesmus obliquus TaxID=3088 RepID=A0ABY8UGP3_TETOB|nr:hypothetical protein OEZ85_005056 [Tetradesmus obliquus]